MPLSAAQSSMNEYPGLAYLFSDALIPLEWRIHGLDQRDRNGKPIIFGSLWSYGCLFIDSFG